jgi:hypothetical protein
MAAWERLGKELHVGRVELQPGSSGFRLRDMAVHVGEPAIFVDGEEEGPIADADGNPVAGLADAHRLLRRRFKRA